MLKFSSDLKIHNPQDSRAKLAFEIMTQEILKKHFIFTFSSLDSWGVRERALVVIWVWCPLLDLISDHQTLFLVFSLFVCLFSSWLLNWNCHTENKLEFQQLRKYNDYYTVQGAHEPRRATHVFMSHVTAFSGPSLFLRSIIPRILTIGIFPQCWQNLTVVTIIVTIVINPIIIFVM